MDEAQRRRSRREFIRRNHPDVGGDATTFREGLDSFDSSPSTPSAAPVNAPLGDRLARAVGRHAHRLSRVPGAMRDAYRDGRNGG